MVVVDLFSKYAYFMSLSHPYSAPTVAKIFMDNVYKLHGLPASVVSDRDLIFLSKFWKELFTIQGVNLLYSSAYHPQTNGQTEIINKCVENYPDAWQGPTQTNGHDGYHLQNGGTIPISILQLSSLHMKYCRGFLPLYMFLIFLETIRWSQLMTF